MPKLFKVQFTVEHFETVYVHASDEAQAYQLASSSAEEEREVELGYPKLGFIKEELIAL